MGFEKATRSDIFAKVFLIAPSGGGKSYSALRMAKGMAERLKELNKENVRIAYIGTEGSRDKYYANEFDYDLLQIRNDFAPERYIDAIDTAIEAGYQVVIIDSLTHEWMGKGGCLEIHGKMSGNSYTNWQKITPRHDKFIDKILDSDLYIIGTIRGKDKYVLEEENGKNVPKKVGLGYQQRDDIEYMATVSLTLEQSTNYFTSVKDNTHLFEDRNGIISEKDGSAIIDWCNSGDIDTKRKDLARARREVADKIKANEENEVRMIERETGIQKDRSKKDKSIGGLQTELTEICKKLSLDGKKEVVSAILVEISGTPNPKKITDVNVLEAAIQGLIDIDTQ